MVCRCMKLVNGQFGRPSCSERTNDPAGFRAVACVWLFLVEAQEGFPFGYTAEDKHCPPPPPSCGAAEIVAFCPPPTRARDTYSRGEPRWGGQGFTLETTNFPEKYENTENSCEADLKYKKKLGDISFFFRFFQVSLFLCVHRYPDP